MSLEHGIINSVSYENGAAICDVQPVRVDTEYKNIPVMKPFSGQTRMPKPGQKVVMGKFDDGARVVLGFLTREDSYPGEMKPGEITIQLDDSTKVEMVETSTGDYDLKLSASGDVSVSADKNVSITGASNVKIDGIDFDQHTHDYDDSTIEDTGDGSGSESTTTKTTDPPA